MSIEDNLRNLLKTIPDHVKLVAVSKTQSVESILHAFNTGQRIFGENKVQELSEKQPQLPTDIKWQMLGHLQTNKVKYIAPFVSLIHSVDSLKLLKEIDNEAAKNKRIIDCLLEIYIAREESKFGLTMEEALDILNSDDYKKMNHIRICGVMGVASFIDDLAIVRGEFKTLTGIFSELKSEFFPDKDYFSEISMGMSSDYQIAIEEGATMVRIGTAVFGERDYSK